MSQRNAGTPVAQDSARVGQTGSVASPLAPMRLVVLGGTEWLLPAATFPAGRHQTRDGGQGYFHKASMRHGTWLPLNAGRKRMLDEIDATPEKAENQGDLRRHPKGNAADGPGYPRVP